MKTVLIVLALSIMSCAPALKTALPEDELLITRRYIGTLTNQHIIKPAAFGTPGLVGITTTLDSVYSNIVIYDKRCELPLNTPLYIHRVYYRSGGVFGYWVYNIETADNHQHYRISEMTYNNKVLLQTWY